MTTTIYDLPSDLVLEILSRFPLKSMRPVRLTCKKWNDLSRTRSFMKMQNGQASAAAKEGGSPMMVVVGYNGQDIYLKSIVVNGDSYEEHKGKLSCANEQIKISQIYHCQGLLLCILKNDSRVLVWNPYLGETRWIETRYSHSINKWDVFSYALGYEDTKSRRSLKLLRFVDFFYHEPEDQIFWYELYDFESGLWTTLDVTPHWCISFDNFGVSLKGNTYWLSREGKLDNTELSLDSIICFDFTRERFDQLLPLPFSIGDDDYVALSCVREEKLAVLLQHGESNPYELDIWITTKIEAPQELSWRKFLRVQTVFDKMVPFISNGFFIEEEKKVAIIGDVGYFGLLDYPKKINIIGDGGYFRKLDVFLGEHGDQKYCRPHVCSYVPSLVQIKQPSGGECKEQSELEKRRYYEYMSRLFPHVMNQ